MSRDLDHLARVSAALERTGVRHAFVGGATIELFLDALGAAQARATDDVDCVVDVHDRAAYYELEARLRDAGFVNGTEPGDPVCRWRVDGIAVDVMPVDDAISASPTRSIDPLSAPRNGSLSRMVTRSGA